MTPAWALAPVARRSQPSHRLVTAYRLEPFSAVDVASALVVVRSYPSLEIGLADASIVVLAERYGVLDVLTLDRRHFDAVRGPGGKRFRLLPAA